MSRQPLRFQWEQHLRSPDERPLVPYVADGVPAVRPMRLSEIGIALALATYADNRTGRTTVAYRTVAAAVGSSPSAVQRALAALQAAGVIERETAAPGHSASTWLCRWWAAEDGPTTGPSDEQGMVPPRDHMVPPRDHDGPTTGPDGPTVGPNPSPPSRNPPLPPRATSDPIDEDPMDREGRRVLEMIEQQVGSLTDRVRATAVQHVADLLATGWSAAELVESIVPGPDEDVRSPRAIVVHRLKDWATSSRPPPSRRRDRERLPPEATRPFCQDCGQWLDRHDQETHDEIVEENAA